MNLISSVMSRASGTAIARRERSQRRADGPAALPFARHGDSRRSWSLTARHIQQMAVTDPPIAGHGNQRNEKGRIIAGSPLTDEGIVSVTTRCLPEPEMIPTTVEMMEPAVITSA